MDMALIDDLPNFDDCLLESSSEKGIHVKRKKSKRPDGSIRMCWRNPDWTLPSLPNDLVLSSFEPLFEMKDRVFCPHCGKSRHYFCYSCFENLCSLDKIPQLRLPFDLHIAIHRDERISKSTGVHAKLLTSSNVFIHLWDSTLPDFSPSSSILLFPSSSSTPAEDVDWQKVKNVIVVESKWLGARRILDLPQLKNIPHVELNACKTSFWRYHTKGVCENGVSTIESIHQLCKIMHSKEHENVPNNCHCFDDLLWYFAFFHQLIIQDSSA